MKKIILIGMVILSMLLGACGSNVNTNTSTSTNNDTSAPDNKADTNKLEISVPDDIKDLKISVQSGTVGEDIAKDLAGDENVKGYSHYVDAIQDLNLGRVDATVMDIAPAELLVKKNPDLMILPTEIESEEYGIGIKKDNEDLLAVANSVIADLKSEKKIEEMIQKFSMDEEATANEVLDYNESGTDGILTIGLEAGFAPYEMMLGDKIIGVDVYIAQEIAKKLNKQLVVKNMDFNALPSALDSGNVDLILSGITITEERKLVYNFSDPYVNSKQIVVIRKVDYKE